MATIAYTYAKRAPDACVIVTIPFPASGFAIDTLDRAAECDEAYKYAEESALAYVLYQCVKSKLTGTMQATSRFRVSDVKCYAEHKAFSVSWNVLATKSNIRASIVHALKCFTPWKFYSVYSRYVKQLCAKPSHETFARCCADMSDAIKGSVKIAVVGRVKLQPDGLRELVAKAKDAVPHQDAYGGKKEETPARPEFKSNFHVIETKGLGTYLVSKYMDSCKLPTSVCGSHVIVKNITASKLDALENKDNIARFVKKCRGNIKEGLGEVLIYAAASAGVLSAHSAGDPSKYTEHHLADIIKSQLK